MSEEARACTLQSALDAWLQGDSTLLQAYERTHPGTDIGPQTQAYLWAAAQVKAFVVYLQSGLGLSGAPTELLALAEQIAAGPTEDGHGWSPWDKKSERPEL